MDYSEVTFNKQQDIDTLEVFKAEFDKKFGEILKTKLSRPIEFRDYLGYGANIIYTTPIPKTFKETKWLKNARNGTLRLESCINPHGITGKDDIGRTFTISFEQNCDERGYRKRNWYTGSLNFFYGYGRTIEEVIEEFHTFILYKFVK